MNKLAIMSIGVIGAGTLASAGMGIVSAASTNSPAKSGTVGTSGITRSVFHQERLAAEASVLNTTSDKITAAHKAKTFKALVTGAGLTEKTFAEKLKAQLTTDLESKGYTQSQITIALQHKEIHHLRHKN